MNQTQKNLFFVQEKIEKAARLYGRNANEVNLIAVSKHATVNQITDAINAGCKIFGENYIKDAEEKWVEIRKNFPQVKLHFIGHLQSNKSAKAVELFDCIHTVDSKKLASCIAKEAQKQKKNIEIFIQVNIGEEPQKSGVALDEVDDLVKFVRSECGLNLAGLMCIPPSKEEASPYFAMLSKIAKRNNLQKLSIGMSSDFEEAIALGANYVRIGSAIFS